MDLLDLLGVDERQVATHQRTGEQVARAKAHAADPRSEWMHACLPAMGYPCGGNICGLPDGGPGGHQQLGGWSDPARWANITCPDCRAVGRRETARIAHRQQSDPKHECSPECAWTSIPESE